MAVKRIKTRSGFEMELDDSCLDDMELFDAVVELQNGNTLAASTVIRKICGENRKALYDHCRLEDGRVPTQAIADEITDIFEGMNAKNS